MELEIYEAFISAGVKEDKAKAAVESINKEIDKRYKLHSDQLATRSDLMQSMGSDSIDWPAPLALSSPRVQQLKTPSLTRRRGFLRLAPACFLLPNRYN